MPKTSEEDTADLAEEAVLPEVVEEDEEVIPEAEEDSKEAPVRKKVAALKARHRLEDYFEMKRIQDELDYLDDEKKRKAELLLKVTQQEKLEHPEPAKAPPKIKEVKKAVKVELKVELKVEPKLEAKPSKQPKPKTKPKAKVQAKAKPKAKPKKKAKK